MSRRPRQRRQAFGVASIAVVVLIAGYAFASKDSSTITTTDVASTRTTAPKSSSTTAPSSSLATVSSAVPTPSEEIRGVLPNGVEYQIGSEPALAGEVEGISAGILINLDGRENPEYGPALGIASFSRSSTRAGVNEAGRMVVVNSGAWSLQIYV